MSTKKPTTPSPDERASLLPSAAPPPYSETPDASGSSTAAAASTAGGSRAAPPLAQLPAGPPPANPPYFFPSTFPSTSTAVSAAPRHPSGPTAFSALPAPATSAYAHQRALRQADRRARRRFCAALCWGFVIYLALGALVGGILGEELARANAGWEEGKKRVGEWVGGSSSEEEVQLLDTTASAVPVPVRPPSDSFAAI
ncbi:hypothetical protein JCM10213_006051 [Rhodosporidiobolus nylandii]